MKLGLIRQAASVVSFSALIFFGASLNAVARADVATDGPQAPIATFHEGSRKVARDNPASTSHVQRCSVAKNGDLICSAPVVTQGHADHAAR